MREMQRIFVHLQNVLNAGKTQKTSFLNFSDLRKKGDGFCLIQTINNALGGQTFSPNDAKKKPKKLSSPDFEVKPSQLSQMN